MLRLSSAKAVRALVCATQSVVPRFTTCDTSRAQSTASVCESLEARRLMSVNVTTYHYSNAETGANTNETQLTLANVNTSTFGKVASMSVDGQIYGQPLTMTNVAMTNGEGTHDIVLVTTENDSVYAFDAYGNNPAQGYLWKTSLLQTGETTVPETDYGTTDITPQVGITGTPVINPATDVMYVVGLFKETANGTYQQRLYAINISSGTNAIAPVVITASVAGTGYDSVGGVVSFNAFRENQRPALTLANGEVYIGWSSHGDEDPWHGWIIAYNATTVHQDYAYCNTANGGEGGIWMSGGGIAVNAAGDLFFTSGNGTFDANIGSGDYGMALEELSPTLQPLDYFSPYNEQNLSNADLDYGCANVILMPTQSGAYPDEVLSAGKWGTIYLNDSDTGKLGEINANGTGPNNDLGQTNLAGANTNAPSVHNTMVYWNGSVYLGGDTLTLQAFSATNGVLGTTPTSQTSHVFGTGQEDGQGAGLTVSSNGSSNGIVWALDNSGFLNSPAVLYAYNASNLSQVLWTSSQAANGRDTAGIGVKFQDPVVANGYVYVAGDGTLTIYGTINPSTATPNLVTPAAANPSTVTGTTTDLSVLGSDPAADLRPTYTWTASTVPNGAAIPTFSVNGSNSANDPVVTFYQAGNYTFTATISDPNSGLTITSSVNVTVNQVLTALTVSPTSATLFEGNTQQLTAAVVDQFGNPMAAQPTLTWSLGSGGAGGSVSSTGLYTAPSAMSGTDIVTVTAGSRSASATLTVVPTSATLPVNLSAYENTIGIVTNGVAFNGGLDGGGSAYSGALLGTSLVWTGSTFSIPAATAANNVNNVVYGTGQTIALTQNKYSAIKFLGAHVNGNAIGLAFTVTYTDGSTQAFTQSSSDWYTPQNYAGESTALAMAYRVNNDGTLDNRVFNLYGYSFAVNSSKTVRSITLPNDNDENVVAIDLVGVAGLPTVTTAASASPSPVNASSTTLSALGTDPAGDAAPVYTWAASNIPSGATTPTFSVNSTAGANVSTATFYQAGTYTFTVTITDPSTALSSTGSVNVTVNQVFSGVSVTPSTASVTENTTQQFTAIAVDQFGTAMATQQVSFTWAVSTGGVGGTVSNAGLYTSPAALGSDTVTARSGNFVGSATVTVVRPVAAVQVNLSGDFNLVGIVGDGTTFSGTGGIDNVGSALSGTLLGTTQTWNGSSFTIAPTTTANNVDNVIDANGQTLLLPQGNDVGLKLLALHLNGNQPGLVLSVNYTDGTTQTITQSVSDWYTPQNYPGESIAVGMAYRDNANATLDNRAFYLYGYSFTLNAAKTLSSITLPNDNNFVIVSMDVAYVQTLSAIQLTPAGPVNLNSGQTRQFTAVAVDQFGQSISPQPAFNWSVLNGGAGTISSSGLYQAPANTVGAITVQAAAGGFTAQAVVQLTDVATATFYPTKAGWYRAGIWQGISGADGGTNYTSPAGSTVLISKNPNGGTLRDSYLLFNISNTAFAGDTITGVTLSFNAAALNQTGPVAFGVYAVSNTSWGAATAEPSPAPAYPGATEIGAAQNVGAAQQSYGSYTFNLGSEITNTTNGLISLELNSPAVTSQETGIEIDSALDTPGADPVITVSYTAAQPAWLGTGSQATWNPTTKILNVTGATSILADPGTDQPIIQANGSAAVVTINPTSALQIQIGGLSLTNGASAVVTSLGTARTATNHRVLVLGEPGAYTAPLLNIDASSQLDLTDNDMLVHDGSIASVNALLQQGLNTGSGYWNGNGVVSSAAAAGTLYTVGSDQPASSGTFDNQSVSPSDVEIRYTYYGDANLDGHVDGADYSRIDYGFLHHLSGFNNGDFNYDGVVNGSDYTLIDNDFNEQAASLSAMIAEPAALVAMTSNSSAPKPSRSIANTAGVFSGVQITASTVDTNKRKNAGRKSLASELLD